MFSSSKIQAAILAMNSPQEYENSIELLNNWTQHPESILTALELIVESVHENVKIICSSFLSHSILDFWNQIDPNLKPNFRKTIVSFALGYEDKNQILKNITKAIAHIAVYDFPDEWPGFSSIILPSEGNESTIFFYNSLKIFQNYAKDIQNSDNITESRRSTLINLILEHITEIITYLIKFLEFPVFVKPTLSIFSYILLWIPNNESILPPIFEKLIFNFLPNEDTYKVSLKCLTSIFISRSDSSIAFQKYSPYLIHTLSNSTFSSNQPITSQKPVIDFTIQFLNYYIMAFELVILIDQVKEEPRFSSLIDISVESLYTTLKEKDISITDFKNDLIHLFQIILSLQIDDINENYWQLWCNILKQIRYELICNLKINPAKEFFSPLLPDILQCLYNALPSAITGEGIIIYQTRGCFNSLFFINQEFFINFVNNQQISINLCYLIGILEFVLDTNDLSRSLSRIVFELIDSLDKSTDSNFIIALLFCLTHSSCFFAKNNELFVRFIEFILYSLNFDNEDVNEAATQALGYVVNNRVGLFSGDSKQFTESIVEQSEKFFFNMNKTASFSMFRTCTQLICQNDQVANSKNLFHTLLEPVLNFLSEFLNQIKQTIQNGENIGEFISKELAAFQNAEFAVSIINECTNANYFAAMTFFDFVWPIIFELTNIVVSNSAFQGNLISVCLNTIAWIQVNLNPQEIDEIEFMRQIFTSMLNRGVIDESIFDYISIIKEHDEEDSEKIDNLYPLIYQNFIEPFFSADQSDIPYGGILRMITLFDPKLIDIQWITSLAINGIRDFRKDVNLCAIQCLKHIISNVSNEQFAEFTENFENNIVLALIEGITDRVHKNATVKFIDFLRSLAIINPIDQEHKILKPAIINALKQCTTEPSEGFFENFTNYILSIKKMYIQFKEAFLDLLIVLKKATPGDSRLFEIEPVHQNIIFDEMIRSEQEANK